MTSHPAENGRRSLLDALRGFALVNMLAYHGLWDLIYLAGITPAWYDADTAFFWQQGICWSFILLSGFCWGLSRRPLRHGLILLAWGLAITLATLPFSAGERIWWGILSFLGIASLLLIPLEPVLKRIPPAAGLLGSALLFGLTKNIERGFVGPWPPFSLPLPRWLYQNLVTAVLGFPPRGFYSADYFPLIPWLFLFCAGWFLFRLCWPKWKESPLLRRGVPGLSWLGQHSLVIYLAHQPVLYALLVLNPLIQG